MVMRLSGNEIEFSGGYKAHIARKGIVKILGVLQLENVYYVAELTTSLLSISQLCDDVADEVCFSKKGCRMVDKKGKNLLVITRSNDNCYTLVIPKSGEWSVWSKETDKLLVTKRLSLLYFSKCHLYESCNLGKHYVVSHLGAFFIGILNAPHLVDTTLNAHTLMKVRGKMKKILIAGCIGNQRYVLLSYVNAKCDLVMFTCVFVLWMLYLFNNLGVEQMAICFHCDRGCEIEFWKSFVQHSTINHFETLVYFTFFFWGGFR